MSGYQEIVLHTLFESGVTRINELERYIKDDVVRYGGRLSELEKKLTSAYEEAVSIFEYRKDTVLTEFYRLLEKLGMMTPFSEWRTKKKTASLLCESIFCYNCDEY